MSLVIKTDKKTETRGLTITQIDHLTFLMYRSNYRYYCPFSYNDKTEKEDGRFVGYAGALCSINTADESFDIDFPKDVDVYACPNGMKTHWSRQNDNLINIQNLIIDIDSHTSKLSTKELQQHIKSFTNKLMKQIDLKPNFVHYTGRGVHLWYCIESCHASLNKICMSVIDMLCKHIDDIMMKIDEAELSIDRAASLKLNGLFRLPYTYNTKSKTWSEGELIHEDLPNVNELKNKLHSLGYESPYFGEIKKRKKAKKEYVYQKDLKTKDYLPCLIHRKRFLEHLIDSRELRKDTSRDVLLFAMYSTVLMMYEKEDARQYCYDLNDSFIDPLKFTEMLAIFSEVDKKRHRFTVNKLFDFVGATEEEKNWFYKSTKKEKDKQDKKDRKKDRNQMVLALHSQGVNITEICRQTGIKSRTTVYNIING